MWQSKNLWQCLVAFYKVLFIKKFLHLLNIKINIKICIGAIYWQYVFNFLEKRAVGEVQEKIDVLKGLWGNNSYEGGENRVF